MIRNANYDIYVSIYISIYIYISTAADVIDFLPNAINLCLCNVYDNSQLSLA